MLTVSELIQPIPPRTVWKLRLKPPGYDIASKMTTQCTSRATAERFKARVDRLIEARGNGDAPPTDLAAWIEALPSGISKKLIGFGLLTRSRFIQGKPIEDHIAEYERVVQARKGNTAYHAHQSANLIRRVFRFLNIEQFGGITPDAIMVQVSEFSVKRKRGGEIVAVPIANNTKRHYLIALTDFCGWMKRTNRTSFDPLVLVKPPKQDDEGTRRRRPLTVEEFNALFAHLDALEAKGGRYPRQQAAWTAGDRKLIYWIAAFTSYRQSAIRSLCRYQFHLEERPASIELREADAKSGRATEVAIPDALADALAKFVAELHPASPVFTMPNPKSIVAMLYKDLKGAGIDPKPATGEVLDFHGLRSTAITWMLHHAGMSVKEVQEVAQLSSSKLVERYTRGFRIASTDWVKRMPKLGEQGGEAKEKTG